MYRVRAETKIQMCKRNSVELRREAEDIQQ